MTDKPRTIGLELNGAVFNKNGEALTLEQFLEKIESVGLEYGGKVKTIDDYGNEVKVFHDP